MLADADAEELRRLGARFYASDPAVPLTDSEVQRLHHLEAQKRVPLAQPTESLTQNLSTVAVPTAATSGAAAPSSPPKRPHWMNLLVAASCLIVGGALGWLLAQETPEQPSASLQPGGLPPELLRLATDEDAIDGMDWFDDTIDGVDDEIDPESTRFVATIDGVDIYLATNRGQSQICVIAHPVGTLASTGCGPWPAGGSTSMTTGIAQDLTIAVGTDSYPNSDAERIPLSESVTAIVGPIGQ